MRCLSRRVPNKVYLDTAQDDFQQRFYYHRMSFNNEEHSTFQICLENKGEVQDNAIIEMVHNQIHTSLFKHFQEMSVVSAR